MELIISIVLLVFGILQIILFFKVWGMTNDVENIKNKYIFESNYFSRKECLYYALNGKQDQAYELLNQDTFRLLCNTYKSMVRKYENHVNILKRLSEIIENQKEAYAIIGKEMPEYMSSVDVFYDKFKKYLN